MADNKRTEKNLGMSQRSVGAKEKTKVNNVSKTNTKDLISREEEYKRLNDALEARTASLVQEAESVIRGKDSYVPKTSLLDNISTDEFLGEWEDGQDDERSVSSARLLSGAGDLSGEQTDRKPPSARSGSSRPGSKISNQSRQQKSRNTSGKKTPASTRGKSNLAANDVAVVDDTFMTDLKYLSLDKTIAYIEGQLDSGQGVREVDDVLPSPAMDMGAEAQMRFLKAKVRVMQEELDRLSQDLQTKDDECNKLVVSIKEKEEDRARLQRTTAAQHTQMEKYKRISEDAKGKVESLETQLSGLRKELESMKRSQKQQSSSQAATEVRLNRALEDVEKYKAQMSRTKTDSKESSLSDKRRMEQLLADNKRLEKQKNELMTGFKKQLKLIDILKKQKMHIEAAKMLAFTEDEFVKALDWSNN